MIEYFKQTLTLRCNFQGSASKVCSRYHDYSCTRISLCRLSNQIRRADYKGFVLPIYPHKCALLLLVITIMKSLNLFYVISFSCLFFFCKIAFFNIFENCVNFLTKSLVFVTNRLHDRMKVAVILLLYLSQTLSPFESLLSRF